MRLARTGLNLRRTTSFKRPRALIGSSGLGNDGSWSSAAAQTVVEGDSGHRFGTFNAATASQVLYVNDTNVMEYADRPGMSVWP